VESILSVITIIGSIVLILLKSWQDGIPARAQEERNEEIQKGRADIANGNAAAVSVRIDSVQPVQSSAGAGSAAGVGDDQAGEGDARTLARMAALGLLGGEAAGESGKL
jgi:sortase (surface protein transpeptidase)